MAWITRILSLRYVIIRFNLLQKEGGFCVGPEGIFFFFFSFCLLTNYEYNIISNLNVQEIKHENILKHKYQINKTNIKEQIHFTSIDLLSKWFFSLQTQQSYKS